MASKLPGDKIGVLVLDGIDRVSGQSERIPT